jgi:AraC family transcriptional regulator of adaptative response / DNA-3-methyladenine glycosylase II
VHTDHVVVRSGADLRDTAALVRRVRRWLDLDADPAQVDAALAADESLAPLVAARPGLRVPTTVDPWETVVRAVVGQQVSVAAQPTRRVAGTFDQLEVAAGLRPFPAADVLAAADVEQLTALGLTGARARTLIGAARAVATGQVRLGAGADRPAALEALRALPGVGEWTAQYVALRVLGDPDAFPATDLVLRRAGQAHGLEPRALATHAAAHWSPWRAYAATVLWSQPTPTTRSPS